MLGLLIYNFKLGIYLYLVNALLFKNGKPKEKLTRVKLDFYKDTSETEKVLFFTSDSKIVFQLLEKTKGIQKNMYISQFILLLLYLIPVFNLMLFRDTVIDKILCIAEK